MPRISQKTTTKKPKKLTVSEEDAWVAAQEEIHAVHDKSVSDPEAHKVFFARSCAKCGHLPVSVHTLIGLFGLATMILSLFVLLSVMKIQALTWQLNVLSEPSIAFPQK